MTPCIGWHAPDGCPHWGGDHHGCRLGNHRSRVHVCECGARCDGLGGRRGPYDPTIEHGTEAAVKRHRRAGEPLCAECRRYRSRAEMDRRRMREEAA